MEVVSENKDEENEEKGNEDENNKEDSCVNSTGNDVIVRDIKNVLIDVDNIENKDRDSVIGRLVQPRHFGIKVIKDAMETLNDDEKTNAFKWLKILCAANESLKVVLKINESSYVV